MLDGAMIVWFTLTGLSVVFVVWDSLFNGVTSWVQRTAWILVTIYTGPVGAFLYLVSCRRPLPGTHDAFTAATWKQALNSEMHCLAGDATGIAVAAAIVPVFDLANGWDATVEYLAGFVSGQNLFVDFGYLASVGLMATGTGPDRDWHEWTHRALHDAQAADGSIAAGDAARTLRDTALAAMLVTAKQAPR